jgi:hypothetical protein
MSRVVAGYSDFECAGGKRFADMWLAWPGLASLTLERWAFYRTQYAARAFSFADRWFQQKWEPVLLEMRKNKELERFHDSVLSGNALVSRRNVDTRKPTATEAKNAGMTVEFTKIVLRRGYGWLRCRLPRFARGRSRNDGNVLLRNAPCAESRVKHGMTRGSGMTGGVSRCRNFAPVNRTTGSSRPPARRKSA